MQHRRGRVKGKPDPVTTPARAAGARMLGTFWTFGRARPSGRRYRQAGLGGLAPVPITPI